ncbi:hypothetical protein [Paramagnetospirillum magneticum]|uniref:Uncharacterized protein n=1 Tax=Paramagnetospirillum magneticum (strain ATCC 700264 / AMB-1) TaxID=342108 RepID=Q2W2F3_PARM1|nr:hypothetical protein [Paramagnetospirillum magneticum]BAE51972.1 hypothetical protein amb3168 [Paramagnetospirillum magneticum AMB-1]
MAKSTKKETSEKIFGLMFSSNEYEHAEASRKLVEHFQRNNVHPDDVHLVVYGDEDDFVASMLQKADREIDECLADIEGYQDEIARLRDEVKDLKASVAAKDRRLAKQQAEMVKQKAEITGLRSEVDSLSVKRPTPMGSAMDASDRAELESYRLEDGVNTAAAKRELRGCMKICSGWKATLWNLLNHRGLARSKATVYRWLAGRSKMPAQVLDIIRAEARRLAGLGIALGSAEWWQGELTDSEPNLKAA